MTENLTTESSSFALTCQWVSIRPIVTAFLFSVLTGDWIIGQLQRRQGKGQPIRDLSLEAQLSKRGTPTMGGFLIWIGLLLATVLWADLSNPYIWTVLFVTISYATLGFLDDGTL